MSVLNDNNILVWEQSQQEIQKEIDQGHWEQAYQQIKEAALIIAAIRNETIKSQARKQLQEFQVIVIPQLIQSEEMKDSSSIHVDTMKTLQESARQLHESEQMGIQTLDHLQQQRKQMEHSRGILDTVRDALQRSSFLLTKMIKRG